MSTPYLQNLVYDKKYDAVLRNLAKSKKNPEESLEVEGVSEDWKAIVAMRQNELVEQEVARKKRDGEQEEDAPAAEDTAIQNMRKPHNEFAENSEAYWLSLANATVRRLVSCVVVPATQGQIQRVVSQSALKDIELPEGSEKRLGVVLLLMKQNMFDNNPQV